jgi:biopolymer transport protein ExbB
MMQWDVLRKRKTTAWILAVWLLCCVGSAQAQAPGTSPPTSTAQDTLTDTTAAAPPVAAPEPEPEPEPQPPQSTTSGFIEFFNKGGIFMWPLLACSIIGLAAIIERAITLQRASTNTKKFIARVIQELRSNGVRAAIELCQSTRGPIAAIVHSGLVKADQGPEAVEKAIEAAGGIEVSFLQRGLMIMATVANVAPLLGFLGTVSGMINAFEAIAAAEQVSAKLVASGISEALITTLAGLVIAIPVQIAHNYFLSRIDRFIIEMEESSIDLVNELETGNIRA